MKNKRERVKQQLSLAPDERDEYFNPKKYQFPDLKTIIFFLFGGLIALLAIMIINSQKLEISLKNISESQDLFFKKKITINGKRGENKK